MVESIDPEDRRLSEAQVRQIIERAVALDARDILSVRELRSIADEIGISSRALSLALHEVLAAEKGSDAARVHGWLSSFGPRIRLSWMAVAGATWGSITAMLDARVNDASLIDLPSVMVLICVSLALPLLSTLRHYHATLPGKLVALWLAYMAGWAITHGDVTSDLVFGVGSIGLGVSVIASAILRIRHAQEWVADGR
ncbi:MAG: hypothetical protein ACRENP_04130 [Longimicrobiales bacterium]